MNDLELANYRITELVSHGRDLDVYEVWSLERSCACMAKVIRPDRWSERQEERLRLEAKLLLTLTHPHLVRAYELIERPTLALIEEMHGGQTLGALLVERPRLPLVHLANMIEQLCSVVGYLHGNGVLHLDIKPSNIIADNGRLVLIDLSLAHAPGVGPRGWGTRSYLSPEQATGGPYTAATDVWAVGLMAYIAATGISPFDDSTDTSDESLRTPYRQATERPSAISSARRLPKTLARVIDACLSLDASQRPTIAELAAVVAGFAT